MSPPGPRPSSVPATIGWPPGGAAINGPWSAVGNSLLTITYYLLSDLSGPVQPTSAPTGTTGFTPLRRKGQLITELERLSGKKVLGTQEAAA